MASKTHETDSSIAKESSVTMKPVSNKLFSIKGSEHSESSYYNNLSAIEATDADGNEDEIFIRMWSSATRVWQRLVKPSTNLLQISTFGRYCGALEVLLAVRDYPVSSTELLDVI